ncbi:MAG: hypothetical protein AB3N28_15225 [Kordiimonas sp.]
MSPLTLFHIVTGTIAVFSGAIALIAPKGKPLHRRAGKIFYFTMMAMAASGAVMGYIVSQAITVVAGCFTGYLVTTSWDSVRRKYAKPGTWELCTMFVGLIVGLTGVMFGFEALNSEAGLKDGFTPFPYFFMGGLALFATALDASLFFRAPLSYKHKIARHLWRMCFAYFIAAGSLFTGPGAVAFPEAIRQSGILDIPEPLILLLMIFWLVRTLYKKPRKKALA